MCTDALTLLSDGPFSSCSSKLDSAVEASALALKTCFMTLPVRGRRLRRIEGVTGGSAGAPVAIVPCACAEAVVLEALVGLEPPDVLESQALGGGIGVVVYCARVCSGYSQLLGAQTPIKTRHAATSRLTLCGCGQSEGIRKKSSD